MPLAYDRDSEGSGQYEPLSEIIRKRLAAMQAQSGGAIPTAGGDGGTPRSASAGQLARGNVMNTARNSYTEENTRNAAMALPVGGLGGATRNLAGRLAPGALEALQAALARVGGTIGPRFAVPGAQATSRAVQSGTQAASTLGRTGSTGPLGSRMGGPGVDAIRDRLARIGGEGGLASRSGAGSRAPLTQSATPAGSPVSASTTAAVSPAQQAIVGRLGRIRGAVNPATIGAGGIVGAGVLATSGGESATPPDTNLSGTAPGVPDMGVPPGTSVIGAYRDAGGFAPPAAPTDSAASTGPIGTPPPLASQPRSTPGVSNYGTPPQSGVQSEERMDGWPDQPPLGPGYDQRGGLPEERMDGWPDQPPLGPGQPGASGGIGGGGLDQITQSLLTDIQSLRSEAQNSQAPDVMSVFLTQGKGLIDLIDQQMAELRSESEQEGREIDPATRSMLDQMRKTLDDNLRSTQEDLNRRGLLHSGILLDLEQKLRSGSMSDQARLMSDRISKIQQNLRDSLGRMRGQKVRAAQDFGMAGARAQAGAEGDALDRKRSLMERIAQTGLGLRGQVSDETQTQARIGEDARQFAIRQALENRRLAEDRRQYDETLGMNKAKFNIEQTYKQTEAERRREAERALVERQIAAGRYARSGSSGDSISAQRLAFDREKYAAEEAQKAAAATSDRQYRTHIAAQDLVTASGTREAARAAIAANRERLIGDGVDISYLERAADALPSQPQKTGPFGWW